MHDDSTVELIKVAISNIRVVHKTWNICLHFAMTQKVLCFSKMHWSVLLAAQDISFQIAKKSTKQVICHMCRGID